MGSSGTRREAFAAYMFLVQIKEDKEGAGYFRSVSGLKSEAEVFTVQEGGVNEYEKKLIGRTKHPNLVLKQGFADAKFWKWRQEFTSSDKKSKITRFSGTIVQLGPGGKEVHTWKFEKGWICKWEGPDFDASKNEISVETIEIAHEGLTLVGAKAKPAAKGAAQSAAKALAKAAPAEKPAPAGGKAADQPKSDKKAESAPPPAQSDSKSAAPEKAGTAPEKASAPTEQKPAETAKPSSSPAAQAKPAESPASASPAQSAAPAPASSGAANTSTTSPGASPASGAAGNPKTSSAGSPAAAASSEKAAPSGARTQVMQTEEDKQREAEDGNMWISLGGPSDGSKSKGKGR